MPGGIHPPPVTQTRLMTRFAGLDLITAVRRQRSRIDGVENDVRRGGIGVMTAGAGETVGIGHPTPAGLVRRMAGLAVEDIHRVGYPPVAPEARGLLMAHRDGRVIQV